MNNAQAQSPMSTDPASVPHRGKFNFWRWFWISTIPVSLLWVWYDFYVPTNNVVWAKDYSSAKQQAAKSGKPMILFFTGNWCVPCRIMKRTVWADKQVEATVNTGFTPVLIDVDDPAESETVKRYGVVGTPITILIDPNENVLERVEGGLGKTAFLDLLGKVKSSTVPLAP